MWWPAIGGLVVGVGGYFQPRAFGVGYAVIGDLLQHHLVLSAALALLLVKSCIWAVALGSGTSGGVLAPLLMIGAGVGSVLSVWLPGGTPQLWALVCMAAILGGTMRAPLTAVVFAFGLTHDVNAFLPTLLGSVIAYGFTAMVMRRSILTEKIARRGRHVFREYAVDPLDRHFVDEVMTQHVVSIAADELAGDVLDRYFGASQRHRAYPVVDRERLLGMLDRDLLQGLSVGQRREPVSGLPFRQMVVALPGDTCRVAATRLVAEGLERLPVVDDPDTRRAVGIVSYPDLLKPTRATHEEEVQRERTLSFRTATGATWLRR
jgi:CBS domain-containing protein